MGTGASVPVEAPVGKDEAQKIAGKKVLSNAPLRTHCSCRNNTDTFRVILLACVVSCVLCVCWAREMANLPARVYYSGTSRNSRKWQPKATKFPWTCGQIWLIYLRNLTSTTPIRMGTTPSPSPSPNLIGSNDYYYYYF